LKTENVETENVEIESSHKISQVENVEIKSSHTVYGLLGCVAICCMMFVATRIKLL
jgi:hypothetical protein